MVSVVNGLVCQSSCDEAVARKGHDPRNPNDDPVKAAALAAKGGKSAAADGNSGPFAPAKVSFGRDQSTVATRLDADGDRRNPQSPALFHDRSA